MGYPILMSTASQLLDFHRRTSTNFGIITQTRVTLGGKTILLDFMVTEDPLDFSMLLECDYFYSMQFLVSTLFHVI